MQNFKDKMYFDRAEQKKAKMYLQYELSYIEATHQCL